MWVYKYLECVSFDRHNPIIITVMVSYYNMMPAIFMHFLQHSYHCHNASVKSTAVHENLLLLESLLGEGQVSQLALHPQLMHQQWEHCPRWRKSHGDYCYECHALPNLLFLNLLIQQFVHPPGRLLSNLRILVKSGLNHFSRHDMALECPQNN